MAAPRRRGDLLINSDRSSSASASNPAARYLPSSSAETHQPASYGLAKSVLRTMPEGRRFPPPWSIEEGTESFTVKDANGQALAYLYFEDEPQRQMSMRRLSRDEASLIAVNIAKLPSVPRPILKDIPRPPNSASLDGLVS